MPPETGRSIVMVWLRLLGSIEGSTKRRMPRPEPRAESAAETERP